MDRCKECDRPECPAHLLQLKHGVNYMPSLAAFGAAVEDCAAHRVDWRENAKQEEARRIDTERRYVAARNLLAAATAGREQAEADNKRLREVAGAVVARFMLDAAWSKWTTNPECRQLADLLAAPPAPEPARRGERTVDELPDEGAD